MAPRSSADSEPSSASGAGSSEFSSLYNISDNDPDRSWTPTQAMAPEEVEHISELMAALGELRRTERELSEASRRYMKLNETDMRAIHYLSLCANRGILATPGSIARHLNISTASTTKLLDRLQAAGHITRAQHPKDRRAFAIHVTPQTHQVAVETVGRQQAKRIHAAARLSAEEREVVIGFLRDMAAEIAPHGEPWAADPAPGR